MIEQRSNGQGSQFQFLGLKASYNAFILYRGAYLMRHINLIIR